LVDDEAIDGAAGPQADGPAEAGHAAPPERFRAKWMPVRVKKTRKNISLTKERLVPDEKIEAESVLIRGSLTPTRGSPRLDRGDWGAVGWSGGRSFVAPRAGGAFHLA